MGPGDLKQITSQLAKMQETKLQNSESNAPEFNAQMGENLGANANEQNLKIIGFSSSEDCGAFALPQGANAQLGGSHILLSTADFITPIVDDPYIFGQIAAANSLSDIFAMGGRAVSALNLFMWDRKNVSADAAAEILKGGLSKILECGAQLLGGHTTSDAELKYGLSVNGVVEKSRVWRNNTPQIGDALLLTKPLGSGIISTALKAREIEHHAQMIENLTFLNCYAAQIARDFEIHACTDITGFGLIGHLLEMCSVDSVGADFESRDCENADSKNAYSENVGRAGGDCKISESNGANFGIDGKNGGARAGEMGGEMRSEKVGALLYSQNIIFYEKVLQIAQDGIIPGGTYTNFENYKAFVRVACDLSDEILFYDVQTSGGLLFALPKSQAQILLEKLHKSGISSAAIIGEITARNCEKTITLG